MGRAPHHPQDTIERFAQEFGAGSWAEVVIVVVRIAGHLAIHGCQNLRLAEEATLVFGGRRSRAAGRNDPTAVRAWGARLLERTASWGVVLREGSEGAGGAAGPGTSNRAFAAVSTPRRARGRCHSQPTSRTALRTAADRAAGVPRRSRDGSLRLLVKVPQHRESPRGSQRFAELERKLPNLWACSLLLCGRSVILRARGTANPFAPSASRR